MNESPLEVDDAVVLLLGAPSRMPQLAGRLQGVTRLEKMIFLLERETSLRNLLTEDGGFTAYNFGPFSAKVYQAVDTLTAAKLITDSATASDTTADSWERFAAIDDSEDAPPEDPYATRDFALTDRGRRYYDALVRQLPSAAVDELAKFKARFASLPLRQLVRYVYQRYPDYTERSLIRDEILGRHPSHEPHPRSADSGDRC
jgi:uncharacterized protein